MFLQKSKMQTGGKIKNINFSVILLPKFCIFFQTGFFRKYSMFRRSITLKKVCSTLKLTNLGFFLEFFFYFQNNDSVETFPTVAYLNSLFTYFRGKIKFSKSMQSIWWYGLFIFYLFQPFYFLKRNSYFSTCAPLLREVCTTTVSKIWLIEY